MFNFFRKVRHYRAVAKAAYEQEQKQGKKPKLKKNEREFQAAAIEILETPASPAGRLLGLLIIIIFSSALVWSVIGRIDIHATLQGKIIPVGNVKVIEPLVTGKVTRIHVQQGQSVKEGDLLLELDPTEQMADLTRLKEDLLTAQTVSLRLKTVLKAIQDNQKARSVKLPETEKTPAEVIEVQQRVLTRTLTAYEAEQAGIEGEIAQRKNEVERTHSTLAERDKLIEVMTERVQMLEKLEGSGSGSRATYLEKAQGLYEQRASVAAERGRLAELRSAIVTLEAKAEERREVLLHKLTEELAENEKKIASLKQEVLKAATRETQSRLYAPVSGTVQQLSVYTLGDVLTTGQQAMIIVPKETRLEVEAFLQNKDKGFVMEGQAARVKIETFNFTKYGVIQGEVMSVSEDAISPVQAQSPAAQQAMGGAGGAPGSGGPLVFPVRIALKEERILVNGQYVRLSPGMSVSAEVKTGDRRIIEFLLSPIMQMKDEALRER